MKLKPWLFFLLIILFLAGVKFLFLQNPATQGAQGKPQGNAAPVGVTAYVVRPEKTENKLFATGTIYANEEADLVPEMSGKITGLYIKEGTYVNKGDLLVKLNDAELQAQLNKSKSQLELAKIKEAREKKLVEAGAIGREEYEGTLNQLNGLNADVEYAQTLITKTEIRAPFSGKIGLKNVSEGSYISPSVKVASIQQIDPLKIDFFVPEKYASLIVVGNMVHFTVEEIEGIFEAKIIATEPKVDIATRTVKVRAICANKQERILPGAFAKTEIVLKNTDSSLMVPTEALVAILKGYKVFVSRGGKAEEVNVITGLRTEQRVQITKGLQAGDTVITTGIMQLKAGTLTKIINVKL